MCTVKELNKALNANNQTRDKNLSNKLLKLKEDLAEHVNSTMKHLEMSPEARDAVLEIKANCLKTTQGFNLNQNIMQKDIEQIKKYIEQDTAWKKETWDKIEDRFVSETEFKPVKEKVTKLMGITWGILIACGVIVAYYILMNAGLPTP